MSKVVHEYLFSDLGKTLGAVRQLWSLSKSTRSTLQKRQIRRILRGLREIYFFDNQTKGLIRKLAEEEEISSTDIDRATRGLLDSSETVDDALNALEEFASTSNVAISIELISNLRGIIGGKGGARLSIFEFFNEISQELTSGLYNKSRIAVRAVAINELLDELNTRIREVDEALMKEIEKAT